MSDANALRTTRTKGGRPRADQPRAVVTTWLPADDADRLIRIANRNHMSVSDVVRRIVILRLRRGPDEDV